MMRNDKHTEGGDGLAKGQQATLIAVLGPRVGLRLKESKIKHIGARCFEHPAR